MSILNDEEKRAILWEASVLAEGETREVKRLVEEIRASLYIIEKLLGKEWCCKAKNFMDVPNWVADSNFKDYNYLLEQRKRPPLTALLKGEQPEGYFRIIEFAGFLRDLWGKSNIDEKIKEYEKQERRGALSFDHFNRLFFELKVAAYCKRKGLEVNFIPKQKYPTPDLKISSPRGTSYIECKRKDLKTPFEQQLTEIYKKIEIAILNIMLDLKINYYISVRFNKEPKDTDVNMVIAIANNNVVNQPQSFKEDSGTISVEGRKLLEYNVLQSSKDIHVPESSEPETYSHCGFAGQTEANPFTFSSPSSPLELQRRSIPIRNFRLVTIYSSFVPRKAQSILFSVREAGSEFLGSNRYNCGIAAVEIVLNRNALEEMKQVFNDLNKLLGSMPYLSAVFLFMEWTEFVHHDTARRNLCIQCVNPKASVKVPQDIEEAFSGIEITRLKSLLD